MTMQQQKQRRAGKKKKLRKENVEAEVLHRWSRDGAVADSNPGSDGKIPQAVTWLWWTEPSAVSPSTHFQYHMIEMIVLCNKKKNISYRQGPVNTDYSTKLSHKISAIVKVQWTQTTVRSCLIKYQLSSRSSEHRLQYEAVSSGTRLQWYAAGDNLVPASSPPPLFFLSGD